MTQSSYSSDESGNFAMIFAMAAMVIVGIVAFAIECTSVNNQRKTVQAVADTTALSLAGEISIASMSVIDIEDAAKARVLAEIGSKSMLGGLKMKISASLSASDQALAFSKSTSRKPDQDTVTVRIVQQPASSMLAGFGGAMAKPIEVTAKAQQLGQKNVCIVGLESVQANTIDLCNQSRMSAPNCEIISNSSSTSGMAARDSAQLVAKNSHSVGGYAGTPANFSPLPITSSLPMHDPFRNIVWPQENGCDITKRQPVAGRIGTINPGVYCAGLRIDGNRKITMNPGVYIFKDKGLEIVGTAELTGEGVTLYFKGADSRLRALGNAKLELSAPTTGLTAGFLMLEDPANTAGNVHEISASRANYLVGTIYLPKGVLNVSSNAVVSDRSEYTAIVASRIELGQQTDLFLNTDYDLTDVPVPKGVGPVGERMRLVK